MFCVATTFHANGARIVVYLGKRFFYIIYVKKNKSTDFHSPSEINSL